MSIIKEVSVQLVCNHTACGHVGGQYDTISFCRIFLKMFYFPAERNPFFLDYQHDCPDVTWEPGIPERVQLRCFM